MEPLLQVRNMCVTYRSHSGREHVAVKDIGFEVALGEIVGLMGESGCGKSTTASALLGLVPRNSAHITGCVTFRGKELLSLSEREWQKIRGAEISLVFQEPEIALSPVMRVGNQVAEVIRAHRNCERQLCLRKANFALSSVGLQGERIFSAYPHQLSGGQRQRVVLAQALACGPALLIADEPTASLDSRSQAEFLALLRNLRSQMGLAILLISHSPEVQATLADRLLIMHEGQIVEEGAFDAMYRSPSHPYAQILLRRNNLGAKCRDQSFVLNNHGHAHVT